MVREQLKRKVITYLLPLYKSSSMPIHAAADYYDYVMNNIVDDLIKCEGNLLNAGYKWDNFMILRLLEIYRQWKK